MEVKNWNDFLMIAKHMREAQKTYFRNRTGMGDCKRLEKEFDDAIAHIEKARAEKAQGKLFE